MPVWRDASENRAGPRPQSIKWHNSPSKGVCHLSGKVPVTLLVDVQSTVEVAVDQCDRRGRDARNARRVAQRRGPDMGKPFDDLPRQTGETVKREVFRDPA